MLVSEENYMKRIDFQPYFHSVQFDVNNDSVFGEDELKFREILLRRHGSSHLDLRSDHFVSRGQ